MNVKKTGLRNHARDADTALRSIPQTSRVVCTHTARTVTVGCYLIASRPAVEDRLVHGSVATTDLPAATALTPIPGKSSWTLLRRNRAAE